MRALVIYCHPIETSFNAAVRDTVLAGLAAAGAETRLSDLYARTFQPVLTATELSGFYASPQNRAPVARDVADLLWCDTLIFIYPTWGHGLPALLKGWLDRVLLPEVAFHRPEGRSTAIRPGLRHITRLGIFTTCGTSWWINAWMGFPGRRTLSQGVGILCAKRLRRAFAALYRMDTTTSETRARHLERVAAKVDRLIAG